MRRIMAQLSTPEGQRVSSLWVSRRPASADRTTCRQLQATGQPVCRTQASDAVTSQLPRYEAKCVQRRFFQCGSVPAFRYHGNGATPSQYIDTTQKAIDCATTLPLRVFMWWNFRADFSSFIVEIAVEALQGKMCQNSLPSGGGRSLGAKISGGRGRDTTRKAIDCATTLPLTFFIYWNFAADFSSFIVEIVLKTTNLGTLSPFWES